MLKIVHFVLKMTGRLLALLTNYPLVTKILVKKCYIKNVGFCFRSDIIWESDRGLEFSIRLHEYYWRTQRNGQVTREIMMVVLQNVTDVLVRATWDNTAVTAK